MDRTRNANILDGAVVGNLGSDVLHDFGVLIVVDKVVGRDHVEHEKHSRVIVSNVAGWHDRSRDGWELLIWQVGETWLASFGADRGTLDDQLAITKSHTTECDNGDVRDSSIGVFKECEALNSNQTQNQLNQS